MRKALNADLTTRRGVRIQAPLHNILIYFGPWIFDHFAALITDHHRGSSNDEEKRCYLSIKNKLSNFLIPKWLLQHENLLNHDMHQMLCECVGMANTGQTKCTTNSTDSLQYRPKLLLLNDYTTIIVPFRYARSKYS